MRKLSLTICLAFAFLASAAIAQTADQTAPGSSPSTDQASQQPGYPSQQPGTAQTPDNPGTTPANPNQNRAEKGEKRLKGCVQSQGGQYTLETRKGKTLTLTGEGLSAHVGHEVLVKGAFASGTGTAESSPTAGGSEKTFNVASVEMISDTCGGKMKGSSGKMETPHGVEPSATEPSSPPPPQNQPPQ